LENLADGWAAHAEARQPTSSVPCIERVADDLEAIVGTAKEVFVHLKDEKKILLKDAPLRCTFASTISPTP
jgi:hypothetical protein